MKLTYDDAPARGMLARMAAFGGDRIRAAWDAIGGAMVSSTQLRFQRQESPLHNPWKQSQRALKTGGKTLIDTARLLRSISYNVMGDGVEWGTNVVYGAIHQFGGTITRYAHSFQIFRKVNKKGELQPKFVKRSKSNFASWATAGTYEIHMPARPYLGIDDEDGREIEDTLASHLGAAMLGVSVSQFAGAA